MRIYRRLSRRTWHFVRGEPARPFIVQLVLAIPAVVFLGASFLPLIPWEAVAAFAKNAEYQQEVAQQMVQVREQETVRRLTGDPHREYQGD